MSSKIASMHMCILHVWTLPYDRGARLDLRETLGLSISGLWLKIGVCGKVTLHASFPSKFNTLNLVK